MRPLIIQALLLAATLPLHAQDLKEFAKRVTDFTLPNGLHFILVERHDAPVASFHTYVRAGSANDPAGLTGLANLFERISLKGTETIGSKNWAEERKALDAVEEAYDRLDAERNLGPNASQSRVDNLQIQVRLAIDAADRFAQPGAWSAAIEEAGGNPVTVNAGPDATECDYSFPSNRIELWFLLESQRLIRPVFREFYTARDAASQDRKQRVDGNPQGRLLTAFTAAAFQAHPYRNPETGWPSDLANLRRTDARAFFEKQYVPGDTTVVIVGDVNPAEARRLAERYFGPWQTRPLPALVSTTEPPQPGPKTVVVESSGQPLLVIGYKRPSQFDKDDAAFDVLQYSLTQGHTSLLYQDLVTEKHLAVDVRSVATYPAGRHPNLFLFMLVPSLGHTTEELQKALEDFLNRLKSQLLDTDTLVRAKAQIRSLLLNRLGTNPGMAGLLAAYQGSYGDWHKLFTAAADLNKVTAADIQRVLVRYFIPAGRTTAYTVPPGPLSIPLPQAPQGTGGKR